MLHTMRQRINDERGFTLIELLVVILIIGILAAIAIPSFISQKDKAGDASAKSYVRNMQTAQEAWKTDNPLYGTLAQLQGIEPALLNTPNGLPGGASVGANTATTYTVNAVAKSGITYTITRAPNGTISRTCTVPGGQTNTGGCPAGGNW